MRLLPFTQVYWDPDKHPDPEAEGLDPAMRQDKRLDAKLVKVDTKTHGEDVLAAVRELHAKK